MEPFSLSSHAEPPLVPEVTQATMYLRDDATGAYLPVVTEGDVPPGTQFGNTVHFVSATPDLSHLVVASLSALSAGGPAPGLYEWHASGFAPVSVLPGGRPAREAELGFHARVLARAISSRRLAGDLDRA